MLLFNQCQFKFAKRYFTPNTFDHIFRFFQSVGRVKKSVSTYAQL